MNLPNALTVGRVVVTPLIAVLPFFPSATARHWAFILFLVAVNTDWVDGWLARTRNMETEFGRVWDPLADKLLLVGTFGPMYWLARTMPFDSLVGTFGMPLWVVVIVLGREVTISWFRQYASSRGVIIKSSWPAKWKTGVTAFWQGAAYCWFWVATMAAENGWVPDDYKIARLALGSIGVAAMFLGVTLTVVSAFLYLRDYGKVVGTKSA
jgi:CDP-diacylglycerol--glycerol-3-phosphate 3-phosphatidyltransferase